MRSIRMRSCCLCRLAELRTRLGVFGCASTSRHSDDMAAYAMTLGELFEDANTTRDHRYDGFCQFVVSAESIEADPMGAPERALTAHRSA